MRKDGATSRPNLACHGNNRWYAQFIDVRMEDLVHEANTWRLVRILIGEFDMDLPDAPLEWRCRYQSRIEWRQGFTRTGGVAKGGTRVR